VSTRKQQTESKHRSSAAAESRHIEAPSLAQKGDEKDKTRPVDADQHHKRGVPDRTGGQNGAVDQKRNDEQQYHAAGVAHDPHDRTQERIDSGDPDAGDIDDETREQSAPFNKTYGHHP
jgi:hypothetical protein